MQVFLISSAVALILLAVLFVAVYFYGQFARHEQGEPSSALPLSEAGTPLDRCVRARMPEAAGRSGLALLSDNVDAFTARALSARSAGRSLDLMYYIWRRDPTGQLLAHEVILAADRGVRVRILLDDINASGGDPAYLVFNDHPNIEIRLFNPSRARRNGLRRGIELIFRAFRTVRRMHNKAWIADGRVAIVGGRNIGDEYFGAARRTNFHDLDVVLLGPAVRQTEEIFDSFWNSPLAIPINTLATRRRRNLAALRRRLRRAAGSETGALFLDRVGRHASFEALLDSRLELHWSDRATVISDPPAKAMGEGSGRWLTATLYPVITNARERLEITSPYFVLSEAGTAALVGLAGKGVDTAVLTNSLAATDVALVHGGYAPCRRPLLEGGVRLFEFQPQTRRSRRSLFGSRGASLHTKAFTVDGRIGFIGSFNFDPRSASLNTEMGVLFEDRALVEEMSEEFERETASPASFRLGVSGNGGLRWEGEVDGVKKTFDREPEVDWRRRLTARVVGFLPIHSQL